MKNVMTKAWEIAREGAAKFGGKAKEYFAEALRMAWAAVKAPKKFVEIETTSGSRKHKSWVAAITGTDARWGLKRDFKDALEESWATKTFRLFNGYIYEICSAGNRKFVRVESGMIVEMEKEEVMEWMGA